MPCHDPATESNLAVAEKILTGDCRPLLKDRATRAELLAALDRDDVPLFAMAHGRQNALFAQDWETGLSAEDVSVLARRSVFAYACHTAGMLGREAARRGSVWWGYTGAIHPPASSSVLLPLFVGVFSRILDAFSGARSIDECLAVLLLIKDLYEETQSAISDLMWVHPDLDTTEAHYCLSHIWQRLRVWWPGEESPLKHPAAPGPLLFL